MPEENKYGKIDRRLNIILTVERMDGQGQPMFVHSVPIPEETYEAHWDVMTQTINQLYTKRYMPPMAARIGLKTLLKVADEMGVRKYVEDDLVTRMMLLTTLIIPGQGKDLPLEIAHNSKLISTEDYKEVKEYIAYFTCASWVHPRKELGRLLYPMLDESGAVFNSLTVTEFKASLPTLKTDANTGENQITSQVAY